MKIYTKTGDAGETGLFGGARVSKSSARVEAYGDVDELNSVLGLARSESLPPEVDALLEEVQHVLFQLGAELATDPAGKAKLAGPVVSVEDIAQLEVAIDTQEAKLPALKQFILPGGGRSASVLHLARCVCRRAERRVVALGDVDDIRPDCLRYLNRLSDALFVLARVSNQSQGCEDVPWREGRRRD